MILSVRWTGPVGWVVIAMLFFGSDLRGQTQPRRKVRGHVPAAATQMQPLAALSAATNLDLALGLPLRNRETLTNLLEQLYDSSSPRYRQFLTSGQFTEQFGPTEADYQKAIDFARANGLVITRTHANR